MNLADFQRQVFENALAKGFHPATQQDAAHWQPERIGTRLMLIVSELSEALECVRSGDLHARITEKGKPEGLPSELADVGIRLLDLCESLGIDLATHMAHKHEYN